MILLLGFISEILRSFYFLLLLQYKVCKVTFVLNVFSHTSMKYDNIIIMFYRQKLSQEYSQQFLTLFQQWETDIQNSKKQEEKLAVSIMLRIIINLFNQVSSGNGEPSLVGDLQNLARFHDPLLALCFGPGDWKTREV